MLKTILLQVKQLACMSTVYWEHVNNKRENECKVDKTFCAKKKWTSIHVKRILSKVNQSTKLQ